MRWFPWRCLLRGSEFGCFVPSSHARRFDLPFAVGHLQPGISAGTKKGALESTTSLQPHGGHRPGLTGCDHPILQVWSIRDGVYDVGGLAHSPLHVFTRQLPFWNLLRNSRYHVLIHISSHPRISRAVLQWAEWSQRSGQCQDTMCTHVVALVPRTRYCCLSHRDLGRRPI